MSLLDKVKNDDVWENVDVAKKIIDDLQNHIELETLKLKKVNPTDSIMVCKHQTRIDLYERVIEGIKSILEQKSD